MLFSAYPRQSRVCNILHWRRQIAGSAALQNLVMSAVLFRPGQLGSANRLNTGKIYHASLFLHTGMSQAIASPLCPETFCH
ncbi:hypothetical protein [Kosakonia sacchari]|uniref:hypothetical protein n=1 Tax=Kosakonia sacchari TaxID=1158459 RepID=UPI001141D593|nr:hypothetical protein [Kosakonia sacchari]